MNIALAILLILFAGIMNGSFALPAKYVAKWRFENIWLNYALWGFVILPWSITWCLAPQLFQIYAKIPSSLLLIIAVGGFVFGIGQVCFALAMDIIGMSLGFVINLGIGIGLGFGLPFIMQYPQKIFTPFGVMILSGSILAIIGLIISSYSGILRDNYKNKTDTATLQARTGKNHFFGIMLAVIAGLSSASQNFVFSYTHGVQDLTIQAGAGDFVAANIIWPIYLLCCFIPYALYMLYLHKKNNSFGVYRQSNFGKYYLLVIIMGFFWYGSLLFYCKAAQLIGKLGAIIGWPMFMVAIILSSNFWGWKYLEWQDCGSRAKKVIKLGLGFLLIAIVVLGCASIGNGAFN